MEEDLLSARAKRKKPIPFDFVLDLLGGVDITIKNMFGCTALYIGPKIVLILRDRPTHLDDNGIWIATVPGHFASLQKDFPAMRSIGLFSEDMTTGRTPQPTTWQNLPSSSPDFEESARKVCEMILNKDVRIGKIPKQKKRSLKRPLGKKQRAKKRKSI